MKNKYIVIESINLCYDGQAYVFHISADTEENAIKKAIDIFNEKYDYKNYHESKCDVIPNLEFSVFKLNKNADEFVFFIGEGSNIEETAYKFKNE